MLKYAAFCLGLTFSVAGCRMITGTEDGAQNPAGVQQYILRFAHAPISNQTPGLCNTLTVMISDTSGQSVNAVNKTNITLTSTSIYSRFYSDNRCTDLITSASIAAGTSSAVFYYVDLAMGNPKISATALGIGTVTQIETIGMAQSPTGNVPASYPQNIPAGSFPTGPFPQAPVPPASSPTGPAPQSPAPPTASTVPAPVGGILNATIANNNQSMTLQVGQILVVELESSDNNWILTNADGIVHETWLPGSFGSCSGGNIGPGCGFVFKFYTVNTAPGTHHIAMTEKAKISGAVLTNFAMTVILQ